jgi:hypothetical protein
MIIGHRSAIGGQQLLVLVRPERNGEIALTVRMTG